MRKHLEQCRQSAGVAKFYAQLCCVTFDVLYPRQYTVPQYDHLTRTCTYTLHGELLMHCIYAEARTKRHKQIPIGSPCCLIYSFQVRDMNRNQTHNYIQYPSQATDSEAIKQYAYTFHGLKKDVIHNHKTTKVDGKYI